MELCLTPTQAQLSLWSLWVRGLLLKGLGLPCLLLSLWMKETWEVKGSWLDLFITLSWVRMVVEDNKALYGHDQTLLKQNSGAFWSSTPRVAGNQKWSSRWQQPSSVAGSTHGSLLWLPSRAPLWKEWQEAGIYLYESFHSLVCSWDNLGLLARSICPNALLASGLWTLQIGHLMRACVSEKGTSQNCTLCPTFLYVIQFFDHGAVCFTISSHCSIKPLCPLMPYFNAGWGRFF